MGSESQFADLCPRLLPVGRLQGAGGPLAEQQGSALSQAGATQPSPQAPSQCVLGSQLSLPAHKPVPSAPSEAGDRHPERASSAPLDGGGPKTTAAPTAQAGARSAPRRPKSPSPPAGSGGPSWSPPPPPPAPVTPVRCLCLARGPRSILTGSLLALRRRDSSDALGAAHTPGPGFLSEPVFGWRPTPPRALWKGESACAPRQVRAPQSAPRFHSLLRNRPRGNVRLHLLGHLPPPSHGHLFKLKIMLLLSALERGLRTPPSSPAGSLAEAALSSRPRRKPT